MVPVTAMGGAVAVLLLGLVRTGSAFQAPARFGAAPSLRLGAPPQTMMDKVLKGAQVEAYKASAAVISAKISSKIEAKRDKLPKGMVEIVQEFLRTYLIVVAEQGRDPMSKVDVLKEYLQLVEDQLAEPFEFEPYHTSWAAGSAYDHLKMDTEFMEPLMDPLDSKLLGEANYARVKEQLAKGENVVFLSNHQTEADPSAWTFVMQKYDAERSLDRDMIMVAGDRVTTDPVAVPFSKARNLLCIYSKRHIENPPEQKAKKMRYNAKTMSAMLSLLKAGGKCIWVAPSGGRDRPNGAGGAYRCADFDAKSVEMFRLMATKAAKTPTHFYPVAMLTYKLFPPPAELTPGALGEPRIAIRGSVNINIGQEMDFDSVTAQGCLLENYPEGCIDDREAAREVATKHAHEAVTRLYEELIQDARDRKSPYYP